MTIRSTGARIVAYVWLVFAALNILDLVFGFTGDASLSMTAVTVGMVLLFGCGLAYTVGLRPAIIGDEEAVTIRNPLREVRAPWPAVREIVGTNALTVRFDGPDGQELMTRAWVHQTSPRAQAKAESRARRDQGKVPASALKGRTPAAYAAQQLNEIRDRQRTKARSGAPDRAAEARAERARAERARAERAGATGTVRWSVPALASVVVPGAALIALVIAGVVG